MSRLLIALLLLMAFAEHATADPAAGKSIAKKKCQICHGIDGIAKIPVAPHLAGESQIYLETQLKVAIISTIKTKRSLLLMVNNLII